SSSTQPSGTPRCRAVSTFRANARRSSAPGTPGRKASMDQGYRRWPGPLPPDGGTLDWPASGVHGEYTDPPGEEVTVDPTRKNLEQAKQPVSPLLAGPYGHPFHPILVTVPIGAWVCSLVFDIASHRVDRPGFLAQGSEWLIAIGLVGAVAAAMIGFLDLIAIPSGTRAFRVAMVHMALNLVVTVAYIANFAWRHS